MNQFTGAAGGKAKRGSISRRDLIKAGAAFASSTLIPTSLFAQETPTRGGHLRFGSYGAATNGILDPTTYSSNFLMFGGNCWGNALTQLDGNGDLRPELAESWDVSADAKTWVLKIRQGVVFHNGKTLTPEDVVYTINRHRAPEATSGLRGAFGNMEVSVSGPNEVTFVLDRPNVDFIFTLGDYHLQIQPEGAAVDAGIGTGPYVVDVHENGVRLEMHRNENYWKSDAAYLDSIAILGLNDTNGRVSALQTGDVDLVIGIPPRLQPMMENAGFTTYRIPSSGLVAFGQDRQSVPFDNADLRMALRYAIDRTQLQQIVWSGAGNIGNDHVVAPMMRFWNSELPQRAYDPEQAKFYYNRSGVGDNLPPMAAAESVFLGSMEAAELFQQQANNAGIPLRLNRVPTDGYWSNLSLRNFWLYSMFGRATEGQMLTYFYGPSAVFAPMEMGNPHLLELIEAARAELNEDTRRGIYWDVQEIIHNEGSSAFPYFQQWELAGKSNIRGFSMNHLGDGKFFERVYLV